MKRREPCKSLRKKKKGENLYKIMKEKSCKVLEALKKQVKHYITHSGTWLLIHIQKARVLIFAINTEKKNTMLQMLTLFLYVFIFAKFCESYSPFSWSFLFSFPFREREQGKVRRVVF